MLTDCFHVVETLHIQDVAGSTKSCRLQIQAGARFVQRPWKLKVGVQLLLCSAQILSLLVDLHFNTIIFVFH